MTVSVPDQNDFSVYDVTYVSEPERYVEVAFTKLLDVGQDMRGLAFIAENTSETVTVDGNKLRLYPDADLWQKGVMKRFEDAVDHKLDELGEKNRDASA